MSTDVHQATFGNKEGSHQLLEATLPVTTPALEELRFLVDRPAGHIDSSVSWSPYWGCQKVGNWWAIWRGEEDSLAPRGNMVRARVALIPLLECGSVTELTPVLNVLGYTEELLEGAEFAGTVVERLATSDSPIAIPNLSIAPGLLSAIWPRLWASARRELSLRTVFAPESLNIATPPKIALFPSALLTRWRGTDVILQPEPCFSPAGRWFAGEASPHLRRLLQENAEHLPGDFSVLPRLDRLVEKLDALHTGRGTLADALLIVRTLEAFPGGLSLPPEDAKAVGATLLQVADCSAGEIRTASLTRLEQVPNRDTVKGAVAQWVETRLAHADDQDALWILQHHLSLSHAEWWRNGVSEGLSAAVSGGSQPVALAVWRWLDLQPTVIHWLKGYFDAAGATELWLASDAPDLPNGPLLGEVKKLCSAMNWPTLLATVLRSRLPLSEVIGIVRTATATPEAGLEAILSGHAASDVVVAAATIGWPPLLERAAEATRTRPELFRGGDDLPAIFELLRRHLRLGGRFPEVLVTATFLPRVFDGLLDGEESATTIAAMLPAKAGGFALDHDNAAKLLARTNADVKAGAAESWWMRFTADEHVEAPPESIHHLVIASVRERTKGESVALVIRLLDVLPSIDESSFDEWMRHTGFFWEDGDHQRMARILESRQWKSAVTSFRRSWRRELKVVAWHARSLLSWSDQFWWPPSGVSSSLPVQEYGIDAPKVRRGASDRGDGMSRFDVGIVTMKEEEYEALLDKFSPMRHVPGHKRDYEVATLSTDRGDCQVAITRCAQQGNAFAQTAVSEMLADIKPRFLLVVGIAGGIPTVDFSLGDVVVSDYIQDLTLEDTGTVPGTERFNALGGPLHPSASRVVERLRAVERSAPPWNSNEAIARERPSLDGEHTTDDADWNASIDEALVRHAQRTNPIGTARKIASSDRLIKAPELLQKWRQVLKAVAAVEMESAGAYVPCQRNDVPFLAIRGISDIVGWKRDEAWTLYACHTAAAYTKMLVGAGVFVVENSARSL